MRYEKSYTEAENHERLERFWQELEAQCRELKSNEFEYQVDMWSAWWMPWFIYADNRMLSFSANDIGTDDLELLEQLMKIELVKTYTELEIDDNFCLCKMRYRIIQKPA